MVGGIIVRRKRMMSLLVVIVGLLLVGVLGLLYFLWLGKGVVDCDVFNCVLY